MDLGQFLRNAQDPSENFSGVFCQAESLPKFPITTVLLSELDEILEMSDFGKKLI
jgi:hypothetical protein